jgi:AcrR family transcriptional regulator
LPGHGTQTLASQIPPKRARRPRRSTDHVRRALLESASLVFARRGYSGATTTEIARLAATPPATVYRQFGSKEGLFTAAVVEPFLDFLSDYTTEYQALITDGADPTKDHRAIYGPSVASLYDHLSDKSHAVLALISAIGDPEAAGPVQDAVARMNAMFAEFNQLSVDHWRRSGQAYDIRDAQLWVRLITGLVIGVTALAPLLLPEGLYRPDRTELIDLMTRMVSEGIG